MKFWSKFAPTSLPSLQRIYHTKVSYWYSVTSFSLGCTLNWYILRSGKLLMLEDVVTPAFYYRTSVLIGSTCFAPNRLADIFTTVALRIVVTIEATLRPFTWLQYTHMPKCVPHPFLVFLLSSASLSLIFLNFHVFHEMTLYRTIRCRLGSVPGPIRIVRLLLYKKIVAFFRHSIEKRPSPHISTPLATRLLTQANCQESTRLARLALHVGLIPGSRFDSVAQEPITVASCHLRPFHKMLDILHYCKGLEYSTAGTAWNTPSRVVVPVLIS